MIITGEDYTKWLWGNQHTDGSVYNFTTVPGEGYGDFDGMMDALLDIGYDGWLTMETGFHQRGIEVDKDARVSLAYLRELLERKTTERAAR